jgi:nitroreductase
MDFNQLIQHRYSVRAYRPDPIPEPLLQQVLEAACLAPTAANRQPFRIIVARSAGRQAELSRIYSRPWFVQAPLVICVAAIPSKGWVRPSDNKPYAEVDAAIVMDHLILAAAELGLGTCWVAHFDPQAAREILCLPPEAVPVAFTPLGFPDDPPRPKERRPAADLVSFEHW